MNAAGLFNVSERVFIVTGASAGIGADLARGLTAAGAHVVAAARRLDRLKALATNTGGRVMPIGCDVAVDDDRDDSSTRRTRCSAVSTGW